MPKIEQYDNSRLSHEQIPQRVEDPDRAINRDSQNVPVPQAHPRADIEGAQANHGMIEHETGQNLDGSNENGVDQS